MTTVSIIIAAYNAGSTIERAINSACEQTLTSIEIVVVDDTSKDATAAIVARSAAGDPRVRLISSDVNLGPGFARNLAISQTNGEWIAVLDADDTYAPDRLERLVAFGEHTGADLVSDNLAICRGDGATTGETMFPPMWLPVDKPLDAVAFVLGNIGERGKDRLAYGFMKPVIRRSFLEAHALKYEISRFAEDYLLALQCLIAGGIWRTFPEPLYYYMVGQHTMTNARSDIDIQALIYAEEALMATPEVKTNTKLYAALYQHLTSTRKAAIWDAFARALKRRDLVVAIQLGFLRPQFICHLVNEMLRLAFDIVRRATGRTRSAVRPC